MRFFLYATTVAANASVQDHYADGRRAFQRQLSKASINCDLGHVGGQAVISINDVAVVPCDVTVGRAPLSDHAITRQRHQAYRGLGRPIHRRPVTLCDRARVLVHSHRARLFCEVPLPPILLIDVNDGPYRMVH